MVMYGMGAASIASSLNIDTKEAQLIIDSFYGGFPKVKKWMTETTEFAKKNLYVEDFWGRRRRLPDLALPRYEIKSTNESFGSVFNPILGCNGLKREDPNVKKFEELLLNARGKNQINNIIENAKKCGIQIKDNSGFISQAERQCVNARVQGGAASMSKLAMIQIYGSKELKDLGFKLLVAIHDEVIGECPIENKDKVADLLSSIMRNCAKSTVSNVPFKCDAEIEKQWYFNDYSSHIKEEYENFVPKTEDKFSEFSQIHSEFEQSILKEILGE